MELVVISSAIAPLCRNAREGENVAALAGVLRKQGHQVTVVAPLSRDIDPVRSSLARGLDRIAVSIAGPEDVECDVLKGRTPGGLDVRFVGQPEWPDLGDAAPDEAARIGAIFGQAATLLLAEGAEAPTVIHAHGWLGSVFIAHAKEAASPIKSVPVVLTLTDLTETQRLAPEAAKYLSGGRPPTNGRGARFDADLLRAERITVTARTLADQLDAIRPGVGAPAVSRAAPVQFLPMGVDDARWDPSRDPNLPATYSATDQTGKARAKAILQREVGLPLRSDIPLVGVELTEDNVQAWQTALPRILRNDCQLVLRGPAQYRRSLPVVRDLAPRWPDRIRFMEEADSTFSSWLAGSDFVGVAASSPHRALLAQRYGTVPIACSQGGIHDHVVDCDASLGSGNGFLTTDGDSTELVATVARALSSFQQQPAFGILRRRLMGIDRSWRRVGEIYAELFHSLTEEPEPTATLSEAGD